MMKKRFISVVAIILVLTMSIAFTGCSNSSEENAAETKLEKIKKSGKIILGTSADYPPYEFHKEVNGKDEIVGFDISVAKEIAEDLGVELEIKDMEFRGLLAALKTDKVDFVIAGMTPDAERMKEVDFSDIYYRAEHAAAVRVEDKDKYITVSDLEGKTIGVQKGAIQEDIAKNQIESPQIKALGKVSDLMLQLKNSKVDAVVVEDAVGKAYVESNKELFLTDIRFTDEEGGSAVAVNKGNEELLNVINKTIERLQKDNLIEKFVIEANEMVENEQE
ncbi:transporter substrate-binding domain-containing protein [Brassicibacter mesophilus]|uniref:transporter substrate-binding domain-containing protein n=1 Tax=Brassicibacter mesophilus TaxID=745119 RepID=UPI003D2454F6